MSKFSTIHVFSYGETQIIGKDLNHKVKGSDLATLPAFIDAVKAKRPAETEDSTHHVIHVFEGLRIDFNSSEKKKSFSVKWEDADAATIDALADELLATLPVNA